MAAPLQVRLIGNGGARNISSELLDELKLSNSAPGGYSSASCQLSRRIDLPHSELAAYREMEVIDERNGSQVWYGRLEDPGRSSQGNVWQLGAVGGSSHARDRKLAVIYNDERADSWVRAEVGSTSSSAYSTNTDEVDGETQTLAFPRGSSLVTNSRVVIRYMPMRDTTQRLAMIYAKHISGRTGLATLQVQQIGRGGPSPSANTNNDQLDTVLTTQISVIGVAFTSSTFFRIPEVRLIWTGGVQSISDDLTYVDLQELRIHPTRVNRNGVELTASAEYPQTSGIHAWRIVEDVIGRFCPEWDRAAARIDPDTTSILQMQYVDTATAEQILDDVSVLVPTHYWAAWGNDHGKGAVFSWGPWPTQVALDLDSELDPFAATGSAAELFNRVTVRYKDRVGVSRSVVRTSVSPQLDRAGLVRQGMLDLGSQIGNATQATAAGDAFLDAHKYPTNSGTIKVQREIVDYSSGRTLQPWELRAGVLARVRNLDPRPDEQNATPNGETIFRVSDVSYSAKANEATLTLDSYGRTVARALARLRRASERQRRV